MKGRNDYNPDGKAARDRARAEAGHRCIRCGHPYECGLERPDKGEWSDCDVKCTHKAPIRLKAAGDLAWVEVSKDQNLLLSISTYTTAGGLVQAKWRILTVHHFDGDKSNDAWWNLMALCQVCHLEIQGKVNPDQPWFFEHSEWIKPYVAGFYARKYLKQELSREEVTARLPELLALEFLTP